MTPRYFSPWLTACGGLLFLTIFEWLKPHAFLYDDNLDFFLPAYHFNAESLSHGVIPQINFFQYLGEVWLSDPQRSVFYPPIYLAMWLDHASGQVGVGLEWLCWIHLAGAAVFFERLLRMLGSPANESGLGALVYLTLPIVTCSSQLWVNVAYSSFYLVLIFLTLERLCQANLLTRVLVLSMVKAGFISSGNINFFALTLLSEMGYLLLREKLTGRSMRTGVYWLGANLLALLLALPVMGPLLHHLGGSAERATIMPLSKALEVNVDPWTFLAVQFQVFRDHNYIYPAAWLFLGGLPFLLPLLGYGWRQPQIRRFGTLFLVTLILSTPAFMLIHFLPGYGAFRNPAKMFFFCGFFYAITLTRLMRTLPSHLPGYTGVGLLVFSLLSNLWLTLSPKVECGAEAFPRFASITHLPTAHLREGRSFLVALSTYNCLNPDFLGFDFATLARVPAFAGYDPLIAAQNKREALEIVFMGLPWHELDAETMAHLRRWSVSYYLVDSISPWIDTLRKNSDFREWPGYERPHIFEDTQAPPFAYFEDDPKRALPVQFLDNKLSISTGGHGGTLSVSLVPLPGYTWSEESFPALPVEQHQEGRMQIAGVPASPKKVVLVYHEPWLFAFLLTATMTWGAAFFSWRVPEVIGELR